MFGVQPRNGLHSPARYVHEPLTSADTFNGSSGVRNRGKDMAARARHDAI